MTWVKLDDAFFDHPKITGLSIQAAFLFVNGLAYCNRNLTDGLIPKGPGSRLWGASNDTISELGKAGLWETTDDGWRIHDYMEYQPSKQQVEQERSNKQAAGQAGGLARAKARRLADAQAERLAESKPVPVPGSVPVPKDQNPRARDAIAEAGFRAFYELYPRKKDRGHALKAYRAALRKTEPGIIQAGLERALPEFAARAADKIPYPATWLRGEGWLDEPEQDSNSFEARLARGRKLLGVSDGS